MRKITTILLLSLVFVSASMASADGSAKGGTLKGELFKRLQTIEGHKPTYFTVANDGDVKFQISFKKQLIERFPIYFAYTQKSFWDILANSSPFKETNYNPEFFLLFNRDEGYLGDVTSGWSLSGWRFGGEHESNGRGGGDSRSWNTAYLETTVDYRWGEGENSGLLEGGTLSVVPRVWYPFGVGGLNHDIEDYFGYGELIVKYTTARGQVAFIGRKGMEKDYGNMQLDISYRFFEWTDFYAYVQLWHGHGETLLDYNKKSSRVMAGVALTRW